jgi:predicted GH43/DUF377 family glycosyl hydrolase
MERYMQAIERLNFQQFPTNHVQRKVVIERLNDGNPIISPNDRWWEDGVTFNSAALYLGRSPENDKIIAGLIGANLLNDPRIADGVAVLHYRARPRKDTGYKWNRSFIGLAVMTPNLDAMIYRHPDPVLSPSDNMNDPDYLGVEDPRISQVDGIFYAVYCGFNPLNEEVPDVTTCLACSTDLLTWEKIGQAKGDINKIPNKDAVLFPNAIDGQYLMLHRPSTLDLERKVIFIASSDSPTGYWRDRGKILGASPHPAYRNSWIGAGSVPIDLGDKRYLIIYHTGHSNTLRDRLYHLDAAIFNFQDFSPETTRVQVECTVNELMMPETDLEINAPYEDSVGNVVFSCGTYEYGEYIYIVYGGGDTYILGARFLKQALLDDLADAKAAALSN